MVHHLGLDPHDLWHFARRRGARPGEFRGPYKRPALGLFREHCRALLAEHGLGRLQLRGRAGRRCRSRRARVWGIMPL